MKVLIIGGTGMLGHAVVKELIARYGESEVGITARPASFNLLDGHSRTFTFDPLVDSLNVLPDADYYINCIGIIKPFMKNNIQNAIQINSLLPHHLADMAAARKGRLIHITTDCVFSGRAGSYNENSLHDALDDYGKSKSLGEPSNCMVIRTSIIGEEIHKHASLIAWAKSQAGKEVNGFTNHLWNGITTKQYGNVVGQIIDGNLYEKGTHHVFSNAVCKASLLKMLDARFGLDLKIASVPAPERIDRTLSTLKTLCTALQVPSIESQVANL